MDSAPKKQTYSRAGFLHSELCVIDNSTTTREAAATSGGRYGRGGESIYRWATHGPMAGMMLRRLRNCLPPMLRST